MAIECLVNVIHKSRDEPESGLVKLAAKAKRALCRGKLFTRKQQVLFVPYNQAPCVLFSVKDSRNRVVEIRGTVLFFWDINSCISS